MLDDARWLQAKGRNQEAGAIAANLNAERGGKRRGFGVGCA